MNDYICINSLAKDPLDSERDGWEGVGRVGLSVARPPVMWNRILKCIKSGTISTLRVTLYIEWVTLRQSNEQYLIL